MTGLLERFEPHVFSSTAVEVGKPAPDLFLHAAAVMGAEPSACIVIEDSPAGVEAARRAGMTVLGFVGGAHARPGRLRETLAGLAPDAVFDDMAALPGLLTAHGVPSREPGVAAPAVPLRRASAGDRDLVCAVDAGTQSVRAGIFDTAGNMLARAECPISLTWPQSDHAEHDSEDIWTATCAAVRSARGKAGVEPERIAAIAFDATCSLVVRDAQGGQLTVSTTGDKRRDTIAWLDHRAVAEAGEVTATGHKVLDHVGGIMSPEMQVPKLLWLKRHLPESWSRLGHCFDLSDFLVWRASGSPARSQCTLTAKWTYLAGDGGWQDDFLAGIGLEDLLDRANLPREASPVGSACGRLTPEAASALGLTRDCVVATGMIDAFAGTLGSIGGLSEGTVGRHAALVAGTSSCIMGLADRPAQVPGVWGPYFGAVLPGRWVWEGGQSATGGLLDLVIAMFGNGREADQRTHRDIIRRIGELRLAEGQSFASDIHVLPDFHGNRSPFADPHARGIITGLTLDRSFDNLCRVYWRAALGIALGVRQIAGHLKEHGLPVDTLHVVGGHRWNPLLMELYADATGLNICEPRTGDAVLLGTAMLAASAGGLHADLPAACAAMAPPGVIRQPDPDRTYDRDYDMFLSLQALGRQSAG